MYPLIANFSWDQVLYYLIPLIWILQYFLPGKKKEGEEEEPNTPEGRAAESAQERMRKVREEIRRRVEAQREGQGSPEPVVERPSPPVVAPAPAPSYSERPQRSSQAQPSPALQPELTPTARPSRQAQLEQRLREQRARLAESKKAREAALRRTGGKLKQAKQGRTSTPVGSSDLRSDVFATLKSPLAARKAIVLSEILGPPRSEKPYS